MMRIFFHIFLNENICCDPSSELSQRGGSYDGHNMFLWKSVPKLSQSGVPVDMSLSQATSHGSAHI